MQKYSFHPQLYNDNDNDRENNKISHLGFYQPYDGKGTVGKLRDLSEVSRAGTYCLAHPTPNKVTEDVAEVFTDSDLAAHNSKILQILDWDELIPEELLLPPYQMEYSNSTQVYDKGTSLTSHYFPRAILTNNPRNMENCLSRIEVLHVWHGQEN